MLRGVKGDDVRKFPKPNNPLLLEKPLLISLACWLSDFQEPLETSPELSSTATVQDPSGLDPPSGNDVGDDDGDRVEHGAPSGDASSREPDDVTLRDLPNPPAG